MSSSQCFTLLLGFVNHPLSQQVNFIVLTSAKHVSSPFTFTNFGACCSSCVLRRVAALAPTPPPLRLFVTGGAGVGKSFLIAALHELAVRSHQGVVVAEAAVRLAAPTGVAASNIGGSTLHHLLSLPVENVHRGMGAATITYTALRGLKLQVGATGNGHGNCTEMKLVAERPCKTPVLVGRLRSYVLGRYCSVLSCLRVALWSIAGCMQSNSLKVTNIFHVLAFTVRRRYRQGWLGCATSS